MRCLWSGQLSQDAKTGPVVGKHNAPIDHAAVIATLNHTFTANFRWSIIIFKKVWSNVKETFFSIAWLNLRKNLRFFSNSISILRIVLSAADSNAIEKYITVLAHSPDWKTICNIGSSNPLPLGSFIQETTIIIIKIIIIIILFLINEKG